MTNGGTLAHVCLIGLFMENYFFPGRVIRQFGHRQFIPVLDCICPKSCKDDPTHIKSQVDNWLHGPTIILSCVPCSSYAFEQYFERMTGHDAEVSNVLYAKENATTKRTLECNLSQSRKKRAKEPTPQKITLLVTKAKNLKKD